MRLLLNLFRVIRRQICSLLANRMHSGSNAIRANGFCVLTKRTTVGANVHMNGLRVLGAGEVSIGNNFHSGSGVRIYTQSHNYHGELIPYDRTIRTYRIKIGDNVWLGDDVTIIGNVEIGEGAIVQVGSVVSLDVPPLAIVGGNPATEFKRRDRNHYFEKKSGGLFH